MPVAEKTHCHIKHDFILLHGVVKTLQPRSSQRHLLISLRTVLQATHLWLQLTAQREANGAQDVAETASFSVLPPLCCMLSNTLFLAHAFTSVRSSGRGTRRVFGLFSAGLARSNTPPSRSGCASAREIICLAAWTLCHS